MTEHTQELRKLYGALMEELTGAEDYSRMACDHKAKNPEAAKRFDAIASDELKHAGIIEQEINAIVKASAPDSNENVIYEFMSDTIADAQSRYKGG